MALSKIRTFAAFSFRFYVRPRVFETTVFYYGIRTTRVVHRFFLT